MLFCWLVFKGTHQLVEHTCSIMKCIAKSSIVNFNTVNDLNAYSALKVYNNCAF